MIIREIPTPIWDLGPSFAWRIDRTGTTVADYLADRGVHWTRLASERADICLYKEMTGDCTPRRWIYHQRRHWSRAPYLSLIGEGREFARCAYRRANAARTLAVAPGRELRRLFFALEWLDPRLEDWAKRKDRVCWIGRPLPERITLARQLVAAGVPLDIYSRERWPLQEWLGFAASEVETSRQYRYRIVCENSKTFGYHSEKFFGSLRCGCVTFYQGDPELELDHVAETSLPVDLDYLLNREAYSLAQLEKIGGFMFGQAWEIYSPRQFYDRVLERCQTILDGGRLT